MYLFADLVLLQLQFSPAALITDGSLFQLNMHPDRTASVSVLCRADLEPWCDEGGADVAAVSNLMGLVERSLVQNHSFLWECGKSPTFQVDEVFFLKTANWSGCLLTLAAVMPHTVLFEL